jgi:2-polyprenyl-3-methyl-5-hydroxy-6-metoxy-1,4-benzoquinol methylase
MAYLWQTHLGTNTPFDPAYHTNPRVEILSFLTEAPGTVLDVGCGGGATGRLIKEKFPGTRVLGIEINPEAAEYAQRSLDRVVCAGVDDVEPARDLAGEQVSTVLLLDVLEHLYDPWRALVRIRGWLAPGTRIVASVPNVRNLMTLSGIAGGDFEYEANGVLDITHVRFFTRATLRDLFEQTGYEVRRLDPLTQPALVDQVVVDRRPGRLDTRSVTVRYRSFDDLEDLYALQYVVDARTRGASPDDVRASAPDFRPRGGPSSS